MARLYWYVSLLQTHWKRRLPRPSPKAGHRDKVAFVTIQPLHTELRPLNRFTQILRFDGLILILIVVPSVDCRDRPNKTSCPGGCSGHGYCIDWPHQPHFPSICICTSPYEGPKCEERQPNPYLNYHVRNSPVNEIKRHNEWTGVHGVTCGGGRHARTCMQCVHSHLSDATHVNYVDPSIKNLCGGECFWVKQRCSKRLRYNPLLSSDARHAAVQSSLRRGALNRATH